MRGRPRAGHGPRPGAVRCRAPSAVAADTDPRSSGCSISAGSWISSATVWPSRSSFVTARSGSEAAGTSSVRPSTVDEASRPRHRVGDFERRVTQRLREHLPERGLVGPRPELEDEVGDATSCDASPREPDEEADRHERGRDHGQVLPQIVDGEALEDVRRRHEARRVFHDDTDRERQAAKQDGPGHAATGRRLGTPAADDEHHHRDGEDRDDRGEDRVAIGSQRDIRHVAVCDCRVREVAVLRGRSDDGDPEQRADGKDAEERAHDRARRPCGQASGWIGEDQPRQ